MASRFTPKPAVRTGQKARVLLAGPSGSGKTWTGLETARILAGDAPVLGVDTERGSASLYADFFSFDTIEFEPPFDPRELADLIDEYATKYGAILVDSLSHFWEGEGGTRDIVDAAAARARGNSFAGWKEGTPAQNDMIAALLAAPCHIVATARSKTEYVLETDSRGKQVPKKVGMAPIQRAGIEYEFTVTADLDVEHTLLIDKTRCHALSGRMFKVGHTDEMAGTLAEWLSTAEAAAPPPPNPAAVPASSQRAARDETMRTWAETLTGDQAARWTVWKGEHEGWHKTDSGRNDAYIALGHLYAAEQAAAGEEPFDENPIEGAGDDGPASEGDGGAGPGESSGQPAATDGADSHDVGRPEPEPAPATEGEGAVVPAAAPTPPSTGGSSPMAPRPLITRLQMHCQQAQLGDRAARLAWASAELCRDVKSFKDLTIEEAEELIDVAKAAEEALHADPALFASEPA